MTLKLYDLQGGEVMTIAGGLRRGPGKYCVPIDAPHLASGVYFGRLFTGSASLTRKIILA